MTEILFTITGVLGWISALASIAAGIAALAKLKVTPSGLLLGLGLGGVGCANLTTKVYRLAMLGDDAAYEAYQGMMGVVSCVNLLDGLFWIVVALGLALLPMSLRKLAEREAGAPAQF